MTPKEIIEILTKAKELGIKTIKVEGIEASYGDSGQTMEKEETQPTEKELEEAWAPSPNSDELFSPYALGASITDEELLYWATPYYDELQSRKRTKEQAIKEGEVNE